MTQALQPIPRLCAAAVWQLSRMLEAGETTSAQLVDAYLESIRLNDGAVHAYLEVFAQSAREEAALSDARRRAGRALGALDGVPVAVKDNMVMRGRVCSCASKMLADFHSPYDATVITLLRGAGMPILGRLNMDEFAMGGSTENSAFGATHNPWALDRVPGGSSGGSAAAVAAGLAPIALGSDTGGSIRQPASFCGVVGVKPAYGAVSRYGLVAFGSSLDQIGPLARSARDAAMLLGVLCRHDPRDMTSDAALAQRFDDAPSAVGLTLGVPAECYGEGLDDAVRQAMDAARTHWQALGARLVDVSIPSLPYALSAYYVISSAEASSNLARFDGVRYGYRAESYADLDELYRKSRQEGFGAEVKRRVMLGAFALSSGYQDEYYLKAQRARELIRYETAQALQSCDALLTPVAPTPAYPLGERANDPLRMYLGDIYTVPANIMGLPALSLPCGLTRDGLPVGMSLMGARMSLPRLISAAQAYEAAHPVGAGMRPWERVQGGER